MLLLKILAAIVAVNVQTTHADRGTHLGCYFQNSDLFNSSVLTGTADACVDVCEQVFFRYAVLHDDSCACTNSISTRELDVNICNSTCRQNSAQFCGGLEAQSYYDVDLQVSGPPQNLRHTNSTPTSIAIQWIAPEQKSLLTQFTVKAIVIQTYAGYSLPLPPQWTVQKDDVQVELVNLHPATTYNITVTANSVKGEGGSAFIIAETEIDIPDPEPEQPKIISQTDTTLIVEIKPATNNNGPVSLYRVIVMFVDNGIVQSFDQHLLTDYKQAQEDGTNYYIAAELDLLNRSRRFTIGDGRTYRGYYNPPLPSNSHVHVSVGVVSISGSLTKVRYALTTHEQHDVMIVIEEAKDNGQALLITLVVACIIFGFLLVISIIIYFYLRIRMDHRLHRLPSDHHELTLQGPIIEVENNGYIPDDYLKGNFEEKLNDILDRVDPGQKFPRNSLVLDIDNFIGSGNFGDVIRGSLNKTRCQVHVVSDDMEPLDQSMFLKEFDQILKVSSHQNILNFLGICQTADWLYLLFEDTPYTLKKKLVEARVPPNVDAQRFSSFSEEFILRILYEIAGAFDYLAMHQFVHKKLCSFNVRMTIDDDIKISAFGATPFDDQGKLIDLSRWSAPEVLRFQHYTAKSDVWSFGCLMWESCCLGGTLYANISSGDLVPRIKNGIRPEHASFLFDDIYQLMLNCWELDPSDRPNFSDICNALRQLLTSPEHVLSFNRRDGVVLPYYLPLLENQVS